MEGNRREGLSPAESRPGKDPCEVRPGADPAKADSSRVRLAGVN